MLTRSDRHDANNVEILAAKIQGVSKIVNQVIDNSLRLEQVNILVEYVSVTSQLLSVMQANSFLPLGNDVPGKKGFVRKLNDSKKGLLNRELQ